MPAALYDAMPCLLMPAVLYYGQVIRMPKWGGTAGAGTGVAGDEAMLGLGDIIVPALSLAMFWRVRTNSRVCP